MKTTYLVFSGEYLVQAQRHCSKASAIEAFRDVAVELDCYDQRIEAALYYAEKRSEIAEYPDFLLSLGPRGGVKIERATTAAANSIMLSVLNDGTIYKDRMHCGFAMLQGSSHRMPFRDLANNEAIKQRREFGSKFRAAEISEAAKLIQSATVEHCLETIRAEWNGDIITCYGRKWWDRINGNTYFSARIVIPTASGHRWVAVPFQYGYGSKWEWECRHVLSRMGFDGMGFDGMADGGSSDKHINFIFEGLMKKNKMFTGIYI